MRDTPRTLPDLLAAAAAAWPDRPFLIFDQTGERLTFSEADRRANAIAAGLAAHGIGPGDTVAVMLRNLPAFPLTWLAIQKAGATMVPLNVFYRQDDAAYLIEHSGAKAVVAAAEFLPLLLAIAADGGPAPLMLCPDGAADGAKPLPTDGESGDGPAVPTDPDRLANIQYTSGTTGKPKGCMLSQRFLLSMAGAIVDYAGLGPGDVMLTAQPFYYVDPQWNVICALLAGCPLVVLDRFHPASFWERIRAHDVTWFYCLGTMPLMLLNTPAGPEDRDHKVRMVVCSAIPPARHGEIEERWGVPWLEAFGMTETGADIGVPLAEHDALVGSGSIGRPFPHREARVVDDDDRDVPAETVGELLLRGPDMMEGYFRNPEATADVFRGGWLHTGDLVRQDAAGLLYYVGRKKEMIRRSGENISAAEVEETIARHPNVRLAACLPVPDEVRGEEVKAYVVSDGSDVAPEELVRWCEDRLAYFKVPRYWAFADDLPRTPSERIAKHILRDAQDDLRTGAWDRVDGRWR